MKCYMHVNYIEWLEDLDEITRRCAEAGFDGIELRNIDRTKRLPLGPYLDYAGAAAQRNGLDVVFGCLNETTDADSAIRDDALRNFLITIRQASDLGVKILNVFGGALNAPNTPYYQFAKHGSALATDEQIKWTCDYFATAADTAEKHDIRLCFETHNVYLHDLPQPTRHLVETIDKPAVGVNFDYGNIYLHPDHGSIDEAVDTLQPYIGYVHLKNMMSLAAFDSPVYRGTPLREGDINHEELVGKLIQSGYQGPWAIENVMPGDKVHLMKDDLAYLREVFARCASVAVETS